MTYNIYQLVDEDGVLHDPTPDLLAQCTEILAAETRAAEAARLRAIREKLVGLLPVTRQRLESGDSLAVRLFPGARLAPGAE